MISERFMRVTDNSRTGSERGVCRRKKNGTSQEKSDGGLREKLFLGFVCAYQKKVVTLRRI